ncbi:hypothetical protein BJ741DRAFT_635765 [Chytriomyces cf. hyalinus JEL632]|nr:hypothetical protein BJ741DRAFT_635765 [Chytriomyces cf. hyalinus JEL632]
MQAEHALLTIVQPLLSIAGTRATLHLLSTCAVFNAARLSVLRQSTFDVPSGIPWKHAAQSLSRARQHVYHLSLYCESEIESESEGEGETQGDDTTADSNDLTWIGLFDSLYSLNLRGFSRSDFSLSDVTGRSALQQLTVLRICRATIATMSPLASLASLRVVHLHDCEVSDLEVALPRFPQLTDLLLSGLGGAHNDLQMLAEMKELRRLHLGNLLVGDWRVIFGLTQLTYLNLTQSNITDIRDIASLSSLTELNISATNVHEITSLASLPHLRTLSLALLDIHDPAAISQLTMLETLDLSGSQLLDISALRNLINLRKLNLSNMPVSNLSPLSALSNLRHLYLYNTHVTDLQALIPLSRLCSVGLSGTPVSDVSPLHGLPRLRDVGILGTRVSLESLVELVQMRGGTLRSVFYWETGNRLKEIIGKVGSRVKVFKGGRTAIPMYTTDDDEMRLLEMGYRLNVM